MHERRQHLRYLLVPPLAGRMFIDGGGQFEAHLIDVSVGGARISVVFAHPGERESLMSAGEVTSTAVFGRPEGPPWKITLIHGRAAAAENACIVAGRFAAVPTFTAADLDLLVERGLARRL